MIEINYGFEANATPERNNVKVTELKQIAKEMNIRGWRTMRKDELVDAIEKAKEVVVDDIPVVPEEIKDEGNVNTQIEDKIISEVDPVTPDEPAPRKNKRRMLEYNGKTQTLTAWANELGVRHQTLYNRIVMKGMDVTKAFEMSIKKSPRKEVKTMKLLNGQNYFNEKSFEEACQLLEENMIIEIYIDCIGNSRNDSEQENYRDALVKKYGDRIQVKKLERGNSFAYKYELKD